jgi:hypothetical protein
MQTCKQGCMYMEIWQRKFSVHNSFPHFMEEKTKFGHYWIQIRMRKFQSNPLQKVCRAELPDVLQRCFFWCTEVGNITGGYLGTILSYVEHSELMGPYCFRYFRHWDHGFYFHPCSAHNSHSFCVCSALCKCTSRCQDFSLFCRISL